MRYKSRSSSVGGDFLIPARLGSGFGWYSYPPFVENMFHVDGDDGNSCKIFEAALRDQKVSEQWHALLSGFA